MLGLFAAVKHQLKPKYNAVCIDNWVFQLHYRATTIIFVIATILVCSREYFGEHIRCLYDKSSAGLENVIETFCFFTSTYTIVNDHAIDQYKSHNLPYPDLQGFGGNENQPIRRHSYYQWVPFVLFGQAIMFYLTHLLWKKVEGGRLQTLVEGLNHSAFALLDKEVNVDGQTIPDREQKTTRINRIKTAFLQRIIMNQSWSAWFVSFEILNVINVVLQAHIIHLFIGREFYSLGPKVMNKDPYVLDHVFPKMTKCTFHKYGPSGSIQSHDSLCVMSLNIINEKIYVFLWFWLLFLLVASCLVVVWRLATILLYSRSVDFNRIIFGRKARGKMHTWRIFMVSKHFSYPDWLLLKYLSKNMHSLAFQELFLNLVDDIEETKPILYPDIKEEMEEVINMHKLH